MNGVVLEKSSQDEIDVSAQCNAALHNLLQQLKTSPDPQSLSEFRAERLEVKTGNEMLDQFQPYYFGVAFSFIFSYCTAMPDPPAFMRKPRHRRDGDAPRVEISDWIRIMARRCEASLQKDVSFGFVSWNYFFRAAVNLSRTTYVYERKKGQDTNLELTPAKLEEGAKQIVEALWGSYSTPSGKQKVNGDLTKVRWVEGLSVAAHRLLQNIEHACRTLPGTQEVRRLMRFDTQALRILFGVPVFVTFSPDESHNLLMIRLARAREKDSFFANDKFENLKKCMVRTHPN